MRGGGWGRMLQRYRVCNGWSGSEERVEQPGGWPVATALQRLRGRRMEEMLRRVLVVVPGVAAAEGRGPPAPGLRVGIAAAAAKLGRVLILWLLLLVVVVLRHVVLGGPPLLQGRLGVRVGAAAELPQGLRDIGRLLVVVAAANLGHGPDLLRIIGPGRLVGSASAARFLLLLGRWVEQGRGVADAPDNLQTPAEARGKLRAGLALGADVVTLLQQPLEEAGLVQVADEHGLGVHLAAVHQEAHNSLGDRVEDVLADDLEVTRDEGLCGKGAAEVTAATRV